MSDTPHQLQLLNATDEEILAVAEQILLKRLNRIGEIRDPASAGRFFRMRLAHLESEEFHVMFLDAKRQRTGHLTPTELDAPAKRSGHRRQTIWTAAPNELVAAASQLVISRCSVGT